MVSEAMVIVKGLKKVVNRWNMHTILRNFPQMPRISNVDIGGNGWSTRGNSNKKNNKGQKKNPGKILLRSKNQLTYFDWRSINVHGPCKLYWEWWGAVAFSIRELTRCTPGVAEADADAESAGNLGPKCVHRKRSEQLFIFGSHMPSYDVRAE